MKFHIQLKWNQIWLLNSIQDSFCDKLYYAKECKKTFLYFFCKILDCCDDGMTYNANGRKCQECNPGTYYRQNMKDNSCKSCSPGTYQDKKGQISCLSCNSNNCETSGSGATSCYSRCGGSTPYCNGSGSCVECRSTSDCSGCYSCSNGRCVCDISCSCGRSSSGCSCKSCPKPRRDGKNNRKPKPAPKLTPKPSFPRYINR